MRLLTVVQCTVVAVCGIFLIALSRNSVVLNNVLGETGTSLMSSYTNRQVAGRSMEANESQNRPLTEEREALAVQQVNETYGARVTPATITSQQGVCDVTLFNNRLDLVLYPTSVPRELIAGCTRVIYNRVGKCGSTTVSSVFKSLAPHNNYTYVFIKPIFRWGDNVRKQFIEKMHEAHGRFVLVNHFYFADFTSVYNEKPVYINVIREPMEWFISLYFYVMYGSSDDAKETPGLVGGTKTIDECARHATCVDELRARHGSLHILCGQEPECASNFSYAYARAVSNVDEYYLYVGVQSNLEDIFTVLEYLIPGMFRGIAETFKKTVSINTTAKKTVVGADTERLLREKLRYEYMLYDYVLAKYQPLVRSVEKLTALESKIGRT